MRLGQHQAIAPCRAPSSAGRSLNSTTVKRWWSTAPDAPTHTAGRETNVRLLDRSVMATVKHQNHVTTGDGRAMRIAARLASVAEVVSQYGRRKRRVSSARPNRSLGRQHERGPRCSTCVAAVTAGAA